MATIKIKQFKIFVFMETFLTKRIIHICFTLLLSVYPLFANNEVKLAWDEPIGIFTNEINYKIYYGPSSKNYTHIQDVGNVTRYTIANITPSDRYFAVKAYILETYNLTTSINNLTISNNLTIFTNESDFSSEIRWFSKEIKYHNDFHTILEAEDAILDPYITTGSVDGVNYIYNPSNNYASANFTFLYSSNSSNSLPSENQLALWFRTKSIDGQGNFFINSISEIYRGESNNVISTTNEWNVNTHSSNNWQWEQLKETNGLIALIPVYTNTYITYSIFLTNSHTHIDKFLFTTNLTYNPNISVPPILPIYTYTHFHGSEFTIETNQVILSWFNAPDATSYKIYGKWNDTSIGRTYYYGSTANKYITVPMSRPGHFYYYIQCFDGTNRISTIRSDISNETFFVHGYTNETPWKIYWKIPPPSGIIID